MGGGIFSNKKDQTGAAEAVENWGSRSSRFASAKRQEEKFLLINIHEKGFSTLLCELKWLFVWSLQTLFAAVHSVFTVTSKVLQLYLYCSLGYSVVSLTREI